MAVPLGLLFLMCSLGNWSLIVGGLTGRLRSFSLVLPFAGPAFGILFFLIVPVEDAGRYWWLAPLIEPTWLLAAWCIVTGPFAARPSGNGIKGDPRGK